VKAASLLDTPVSRGDTEAALRRLERYLRPTPLVRMVPTGLELKAESLQPTGAFKIRGALNMLLCLPRTDLMAGVVGHSGGNHAVALAYASALLNIPAILVMPEDAPRNKIEATKRQGAEVFLSGVTLSDRAAMASDISARTGRIMIPPFDAPEIVAGAGTIALEIVRQKHEVRQIFVPVAGGGLAAGTIAALEDTGIRVIGVEPELTGHVTQSIKAGSNVSIPEASASRTIADGLRVSRLGECNWSFIRRGLDQIIQVSEDEIVGAMSQVAAEARLITEPSGAVAVAGAMKSGADLDSSVAVLSGGNVDLPAYSRLLSRGSAVSFGG
jgi:threonine dehydratase